MNGTRHVVWLRRLGRPNAAALALFAMALCSVSHSSAEPAGRSKAQPAAYRAKVQTPEPPPEAPVGRPAEPGRPAIPSPEDAAEAASRSPAATEMEHADAPGPRRDPPPRRGEFDQRAIRRTPQAASPAGAATQPAAAVAPKAFEMKRVAAALAAVLLLIFALKWLSRRLFALPTAHRSSRAVQVLSRSVLSPKQQLVLVKVGRRVIVVADSGTQMNALSEITDADEIAALVGQIGEEKSEWAGKTFGSLVGRVRSGYPSPAPRATADGLDANEDGGEDRGVDRDSDRSPEPDNPAVASARTELTGLMEKVRLLSRQFKGS